MLTAVTVENPGRSGSRVTALPDQTTASGTPRHVDGVHPGGRVYRTPATMPWSFIARPVATVETKSTAYMDGSTAVAVSGLAATAASSAAATNDSLARQLIFMSASLVLLNLLRQRSLQEPSHAWPLAPGGNRREGNANRVPRRQASAWRSLRRVISLPPWVFLPGSRDRERCAAVATGR
jgi:hypothetical protein